MTSQPADTPHSDPRTGDAETRRAALYLALAQIPEGKVTSPCPTNVYYSKLSLPIPRGVIDVEID